MGRSADLSVLISEAVVTDDCCDVGATSDETSAGGPSTTARQVPEIRAAGASGLFLIAGFIALQQEASVAGTLFYIAALVIGGWTFMPETLKGLLRGQLGVGTLMTIAAAGAVALGELGEAATLAFLFSISEGLESYALTRTRQGLRALLSFAPPEATLMRDGVQVVVEAAELQLGDVLLVRPGERIATDGVVRSGRSSLDNSAITGESVPVEVVPGTDVFAAAINGSGVLEVEVRARIQDNSLARIVRIVEEAQERKGVNQRVAQRVARPLVPGVMVVATGIGVAGSLLGDPSVWIHRALVVLVAAAPCAFAISVPVTVVAAIGAASRFGVLIKGGAALEALAGVEIVALDKTGTLTRNQPKVIDVLPVPQVDEDELLDVSAALEASSEHPLAAAIIAHRPARLIATDVEAVTGSGLVGTVEGARCRLGKPGFIEPGPLGDEVMRLQEDGATVVMAERENSLLGAIAVRDELRDEAPDVVRSLRRAPLEVGRVVMLTGDNERTATALGWAAGVDEVKAELLPAEKAMVIKDLQRHGPVAMVGDGVNDAPALATADVGIAMGAMGSDVAIETADVALMGQDLRHLPDAMAHARRALRVMQQNLGLSGAILLVLIPLAAAGTLGLATVVASHEIAELFVIVNGVRAGRRRP